MNWKQILKALGMAAAAGGATAATNLLPTMLPGGLGVPITAAIAAVIAYLMPQPSK